MRSASMIALMTNGPPVCRWQSRQWQPLNEHRRIQQFVADVPTRAPTAQRIGHLLSPLRAIIAPGRRFSNTSRGPHAIAFGPCALLPLERHVKRCNAAPGVLGWVAMDTFDLIVIGSGPAGRRAAIQAAKLGKAVLVVENRLRVGGVSVHTGTIPSKTLRETVLNLSGWRERGFYGPRLSGEKREIEGKDLGARLRMTLDHEIDVLEHQFARNGVPHRGRPGPLRQPAPDSPSGTATTAKPSTRRRASSLRSAQRRTGPQAHPVQPDQRVRQRRRGLGPQGAQEPDGGGRRGDRHRVCDDLFGARRAGGRWWNRARTSSSSSDREIIDEVRA
jgi:hypothetical protein